MQKRISADLKPMHVAIITLDSHMASTITRVNKQLRALDRPIHVSLHAAGDWGSDEGKLSECHLAIADADIVVVTMLFLEEHIKAVVEQLRASRDHCSAMVCCMSGGEIVKLTRLGKLDMGKGDSAVKSLFRRLIKSRKARNSGKAAGNGKLQMMMLRRIPKILRFIPGTAQDIRHYFFVLQYWLAGSDANALNMVCMLANHYAGGEHQELRDSMTVSSPQEYLDVGLYHPDLNDRMVEHIKQLPPYTPSASSNSPSVVNGAAKGRIGLLLMRAYVLAGNTLHYDAVIRELQSMGYEVVPAFASGLDSRPAIDQYFMRDGEATIDLLISLTGFSLVGGPAYSDSVAARETLAALDVPYLAAHGVEFQTLESWRDSERGLLPVEAAMMVALPEIDGATGPMIFSGRSEELSSEGEVYDMFPQTDRVQQLCRRIDKLVTLRNASRLERKIALVIFNFPPNAGATGTAAHLAVFESLFNTLTKLQAEGYRVDLPKDVDELRTRLLEGNSEQYGTDANVHTTVDVDDHIAREPHLEELEAAWGPAPGKQLSNGKSIFILGQQFGNVLVCVQPGFGYEGDPMRLLFEKGFAPTHAFSAFYRYLREDFRANAALHFGTHGALEFMPGKQTGMSAACWPDRLIGDLPNFYLYAANNASEGTIAKRRSGATLVSYLTPPVTHAGLYRGLSDLQASIDRWRVLPPQDTLARNDLLELISEQATDIDLDYDKQSLFNVPEAAVEALRQALREVENTLIPHGLHVVGEVASREQRLDMLKAVVSMESKGDHELSEIETGAQAACLEWVVDASAIDAPANAESAEQRSAAHPECGVSTKVIESLLWMSQELTKEPELDAIVQALDGRYLQPVVGGDLLRTPEIMPTGRNLHGFDPYRMPTANAVRAGAAAADRLIARHQAEGNTFPQTMAIVLWGTDNLKTEGSPIAQVLSLIGAEPKFDNFGRLTGAQLIPLETLGRPRIDVVVTLSGIFRDLLPLQTRLLAEASWLAATAEDESIDQNFVRRNTLLQMEQQNCDIETAALRVFSNADGVYGSNVNLMVDDGGWNDENELAEVFANRKSFAYNRNGCSAKQTKLFENLLSNVEVASQNLDSVEIGVTTVDHYFDTLGGISRCIQKASGSETAPAVYISDETSGDATVRTLAEQVALETRTRVLNPKWYEQMLEHGYEGVRNLETHVTNTMGWSATTGQVAPWVYQQITNTFMLDEEMRNRLVSLNPEASLRVANRLFEAHERNYWQPDSETLAALEVAGLDLEDRLEGIVEGAYAA